MGDWHLSEDILEETFIRLCKSTLEERGKLKNWLFRVATNLSYKTLRKKNYQIADCNKIAETLKCDFQERITKRIEIQRSLMKLPEAQRVVIVLKFYQGMKYEEISEILGCPLGTVKTRMHNGLKKMRKLLKTP